MYIVYNIYYNTCCIRIHIRYIPLAIYNIAYNVYIYHAIYKRMLMIILTIYIHSIYIHYIAVEVAAENALFHIIVDTDKTAAYFIEELEKSKCGGRLTFLPLNRLQVPR